MSTAYGQDLQSRVEELEQNVQAKDRELAQSQQELRQKVINTLWKSIVQLLLVRPHPIAAHRDCV